MKIPLFMPIFTINDYFPIIISCTYLDILALCRMNITRYSLDEDHDKDCITISPQWQRFLYPLIIVLVHTIIHLLIIDAIVSCVPIMVMLRYIRAILL